MMLSKSQFLKELNNQKKRGHSIAFLGMSGSGKTHWSKLLSEKFGYNPIEIDKLIGTSPEFVNLIKDVPGKNPTEKLGNYFGNPWDKNYKPKEDKYLAIEKKLMSIKYKPGTILDLTGSAIYHPEQLKEIAKTCLVIYLETSLEAQQEMLKIYISNPKPVCWNGIFQKKNGESNEKALARCYPLLLKYRARIYDKYADVKLSYKIHKNIGDIGQFVEEISKQLE